MDMILFPLAVMGILLGGLLWMVVGGALSKEEFKENVGLFLFTGSAGCGGLLLGGGLVLLFLLMLDMGVS